MGHNIDLIQMFGLPKEVPCPRCTKMQDGSFDDYDIDCGNPNPSPGIWKLHLYCNDCEHEWEFEFKIKMIVPGTE